MGTKDSRIIALEGKLDEHRRRERDYTRKISDLINHNSALQNLCAITQAQLDELQLEVTSMRAQIAMLEDNISVLKVLTASYQKTVELSESAKASAQ